MAVVEINEEDWRAQQAVIGVVNKMMQNPKARKQLLAARKESDPTAHIPEIDSLSEPMSEIGEIKKMLAEERAAREAEKAQRETDAQTNKFMSQWNEKKADLRRSGYTAEGIEAIEKLAQDRGIPDLEAAAALFDKQNPPSDVGQPSSGGWNFFEAPEEPDTFVERSMATQGQDESLVMQEAHKALKEFRAMNGTGR